MTKKDYELIASVLRDEYIYSPPEHKKVIEGVAELMAQRLRGDNIRFDSLRFYQACGIEAENHDS